MNNTFNPIFLAVFLFVISFSANLYATDYTFLYCSGNWSDPNNWSPHGVPSASDNAILNNIGCGGNDAVILTENISVNNLSISITLTGSFDLTVNGNLTFAGTLRTDGNLVVNGNMLWNGGQLGDGPTTTGNVTVNGLLTIQAPAQALYKKAIIANGGIHHTPNIFYMALGAEIIIPAGQTYLISSSAGSSIANAGSGGKLNIMGTFQRDAPGNFTIGSGIIFENSGSTQINTGTLTLNGGGTQTGSFSISNGATLTFGGGTFDLNGATFSGAGLVTQSDGNVNLNSGAGNFTNLELTGGTFTSSINVTVMNNMTIQNVFSGSGSLTVNGDLTFAGTLQNVGNLVVNGNLIWNGGYLGNGPTTTGNVTVNGLLSIQSGEHYLYKKVIIANGGILHTVNVIYMALAAEITIPVGQTYLNSTSTGSFIANAGSGGKLNILGAFQRTASGNFTIGSGIIFENSGSTQINTGTLILNGGGTQTGSFLISNGATLTFGGGTFDLNGATFSGAGLVTQSDGNVNLNSGAGNFTNLELTGGTFTSSINVTVMNNMAIQNVFTGNGSLTVNGDLTFAGTLQNVGNLVVNGNLIWNGGYLGNGPTTTGDVTVNGLLSIQSGEHYLYKKVIIANGGILHSVNVIYMALGAEITIPAGQTYLNSTPTGSFIANAGSGGKLNILGTFQRNASGNFTIGSGIIFENSGTVQVDMGSVTFSGALNNSGLIKGSGTLNFNGTFTQSGIISPGNSPGVLTLSLLPTGTTTTYIEMQGSTAPGSDYDNITVTGAGAISGTLDISFLNGYEPAPGDEFIIMTCSGGCSGSFSNIIHPGNNPNAWQIDMTNPNQVKLVLAQSLLPVELISFSAHVLNSNTAFIRWETASESDNDGFFIEKLTDGRSFEDIGFVKGAGNSHQMNTYHFQDNSFGQDAYYRLRQVDFDGKTNLSQVVFLRYEDKARTNIHVYPNPASSSITIELPPSYQNSLLEMKNSLGIRIMMIEVAPDVVYHAIDISALPPGFYFLNIEGERPVQFIKL